MNSCSSDFSNSYLYNYVSNISSFGYGTAKGIANHVVPAIYAFGMVNGGNTAGLQGLAANCLSVGLGFFDTAKGFVHLTNNILGLTSQRTSFSSTQSRSLAIAQNIHRIIVGLAMINTIVAPSPLANAIVSTELIWRGLAGVSKGSIHMQKSLKLNHENKKRDWAGIGEALVTLMWAINSSFVSSTKLYNTNILEQKIELEVNKSGFSDAIKDRHAVEMIGAWDPTGALDPDVVPQTARNDLRDIYTVYSSVVKSEQEMCSVLREARDIVGKPLDAAYIGAHGNVRGLLLNPGQAVTTANVETLAGCLKETLNEEAPIFLFSCSAAKSRRDNRLSFAERLASETGHPVYAPTVVGYAHECKMIEIYYPAQIPRPSLYTGTFPKTIFSCVFSAERIEAGDKVPFMVDPATYYFYEYNRLIKRFKDSSDEITVQDDRLYDMFFKKMTALFPPDVWSELVHTQAWQDLNTKWWEKVE